MNAELHQLDRYPAWQNALALFRKDPFEAGQIVPHAWFDTALMLDRFDGKARQLARVKGVQKIKKALLSEDQILLENVVGVGYRVVPSTEQTGLAMKGLARKHAKATISAWNIVNNVQMDKLSDAQRQENIDARGRLAWINGVMRKTLRIAFLEN